MHKRNDKCSSTIQMLITIINTLKERGEDITQWEQLLKEAEHSSWVAENDKKWDRLQYPDSSLRYAKVNNFDECPLKFIVAREYKNTALLMDYIESICKTDCTVQLSISSIMEYTGYSRHTAIKTRDILLDLGIILCVREPTNKTAGIYKVHPRIITVGKPISQQEINDYYRSIGELKVKKQLDLLRKYGNYSIVTSSIRDGEHIIKSTSLEPMLDGKKIDPVAVLQLDQDFMNRLVHCTDYWTEIQLLEHLNASIDSMTDK